ncbi:MAG: SulP family sulfate permease [Kiritimatiellia bacterium]|jgi:sulfate permease, SulP family
MIYPPADKVHPLPFIADLKDYNGSKAVSDLLAGITVAVFAVPQSMAYAMLMGIPPVYGLYAAIVMSITAALWGSSAFVNTGPTNSASLLTAAAIAPIAATAPPAQVLEVIFALTLLVGIIRCLMGMFRFGSLVDFVPESAFLGFTVGVGLMIAMGQLHHLLGVPGSHHPWFPARIMEVLQGLPHANPISLIVGLSVFGGVLLTRRWERKVPTSLIAIVLSTVIVSVFQLNVRIVSDIDKVPFGLPGFHIPMLEEWGLLPDLLPQAFAIALVGLIEAVSIGQVLAVKHQQHINFNQEFFGQGLSQIIGSFFQGIPGSGSFSRTTLIEQCGAVTRFSNVFFGLATAIALISIPALLERIPVAALSGLLLYIGYRLLNGRRLKRVWKTSKTDTMILIATFAVTVFTKIEYGLLVGVIAAAMVVLNRAAELRIYELVPMPSGRFDEAPYLPGEAHEPGELLALTIYGELFYGIAHQLLEQLNEIVKLQKPTVIVLRIRRAYSIDYSCWNAIFEFAEAFNILGGKLILAGVRPDVQDLIKQAQMEAVLPPNQVYPKTDAVMSAFKDALETAFYCIQDESRLQGPWLDYRENPQVLNEQQIDDIDRFLRGDLFS